MTTSSPMVSVVIPTHNRPEFLGRAVTSVLRQTHSQLDVLVIDDASVTPAPDTLGPLMRDPRLRVLRHDTNRGGSAARNTGIRAARGDYVAFLDDDDYWRPAKIERQLGKIGNADASICGFTLTSDGVTERPGSRRIQKEMLVGKNMVRRGYVGWGTSTLLLRRDIMLDLMFDETLPCGQDWDVLIRLVQRYRVAYFAEPLVAIHIGTHPRTTTRLLEQPIDRLEGRFAVLHKHREFLSSFWFNYHVAGVLLHGLRRRSDAGLRLRYALKRCGPLPVFFGFVNRFYQRVAGYH